MVLRIAVLAKQVLDPEMPMAAFRIDGDARRVVPPANIPPVVNGFDENAVEAALRIKDVQEATVTVISTGSEFALDVMKKPLSMGADELVLLQDDAFANTIDSFVTAQLLAAAILKLVRRPNRAGFLYLGCGFGQAGAMVLRIRVVLLPANIRPVVKRASQTAGLGVAAPDPAIKDVQEATPLRSYPPGRSFDIRWT